MNFIVRWLVTSVACAAALWLVPGIGFGADSSTLMSTLAFGLIMALINASIKPLAQTLGLPFTVVTLGIGYLIINTLMVYLAAGLSGFLFGVDIRIDSFLSAFFASIVISIVSSIINGITGADA